MTDQGEPFFWLADTAWELFHRLSLSETEHYLKDRAAKGYTVVQAVFLAELDGLRAPTPEGFLPLEDLDPTRLNPDYLDKVERVIDLANSLGITVAFLPTWGDKWNKKWGQGPEVFTPENARAFGRLMGARFKGKDLIWVMGGDRPFEAPVHKEIVRAMALGVRDEVGDSQLMTFHPIGGQSSATELHDEEWLDFNMWQSGHDRNRGNHECIAQDYARTPVKPVLDGEPGYEDHTASFSIDNGYMDDYDNRKCLYWSLFAGAFGHTYGCHPIWQFLDEGREAITWARRPWREALHLPGAGQMQHAKRLLLSRPFFTRIPDQTLIHGEAKTGSKRLQATRDMDGTYALVYCPSPDQFEVSLAPLKGEVFRAWWFNPRTGATQSLPDILRSAGDVVEMAPPTMGPDWVLVLDDAAAGYGRPGS
jgi:hypothetical protein